MSQIVNNSESDGQKAANEATVGALEAAKESLKLSKDAHKLSKQARAFSIWALIVSGASLVPDYFHWITDSTRDKATQKVVERLDKMIELQESNSVEPDSILINAEDILTSEEEE
ncbi:MAG: hypothetical protein AAF388_05465 [Bacteroidota bacterium]